MTNYMVKSGTGSGRICFTIRQNLALVGFPQSKSGAALMIYYTICDM